jgi:hypothetical protein
VNVPWVLVLRVKDDSAAKKVLDRLEKTARCSFEVESSARDAEDAALLRVRASTRVEAASFPDVVVAALAVALRIGREWSVGGGLLMDPGERSSSGGIYEHLFGVAHRSLTIPGVEWASFEVENG